MPVDADAAEKQAKAGRLLTEEAAEGRTVLSTQVLQEFYVTVTRKLAEPLDPETAYRAVSDLAILPLVQVDRSLVLAAIRRFQAAMLSLWDALIVEAALDAKATVLFTEDLQHGQVVDGLRVENPFL